jgi:hypothetical protein
MRRAGYWLGLTVAIGLVSFAVTKELKSRAQERGFKPFTAVMVQRHYMPGAVEPDHIENYIHAVRSDGSWVNVFDRQLANHEWGEVRVVLDVPSRKRVIIDPSTESLVSYPLSENGVRIRVTSPASCLSKANSGRATLMGYDVLKVSDDFPANGDEIRRSERWLAPGLDCFAVKETNTYGSASALNRTTRDALYITIGEPDPKLYQIPANYTERSPSELSAEHARRFGGQPILPDESAAQLDRTYRGYSEGNH